MIHRSIIKTAWGQCG